MRLKLSNNTVFEPLIEREELCDHCERERTCVVMHDEEGYPFTLCGDCLVDLANELL